VTPSLSPPPALPRHGPASRRRRRRSRRRRRRRRRRMRRRRRRRGNPIKYLNEGNVVDNFCRFFCYFFYYV